MSQKWGNTFSEAETTIPASFDFLEQGYVAYTPYLFQIVPRSFSTKSKKFALK